MPDPIADGYDALAPEYARHIAGELDQKPFDRAFLERFNAAAPEGGILDVHDTSVEAQTNRCYILARAGETKCRSSTLSCVWLERSRP